MTNSNKTYTYRCGQKVELEKPLAFRKRVKEGVEPIKLTGYASRTGSMERNEELAYKRVEKVERMFQFIIGGNNAKFIKNSHIERINKITGKKENPKERRVEIEILD